MKTLELGISAPGFPNLCRNCSKMAGSKENLPASAGMGSPGGYGDAMTKDTIGRPMEILLVEDSLTDAALTIGALRKSDVRHRLTLVRDGAEALEFLLRQGRFAKAPRPDLVLLDLELPKLDGRQLLREMKNDYELTGIPVVVLSASDAEEDKLKCELLHVESYITKPVNIDKFLGVIHQLKSYWHSDLILPSLE